ncbi:MAG: hypothetical protein EOQ56_30735 [Mesorhizobium sp.]|nr:MAG: hypothetical protein EOQ56_30735 [Mesorhizobium sp.]
MNDFSRLWKQKRRSFGERKCREKRGWCPEADSNHRHADFQSNVERPESATYGENTVKPSAGYQRLSADLSNSDAVDIGAENWSALAAKAQVVDTAGRLFGTKAARQLWHQLGLPTVGNAPGTPDLRLLQHVATFVEARLVPDSRVGVAARQLHRAYTNWAVETGAPDLTLTRFGLLMQQTGIRRVAGRTVTYEARFK